MPHTRSAKKSVRKNEKRRARNRATLRACKTYVKKYYATLETGTTEEAGKALRLAVKKIDQTAAKGIIHKNKASRQKSQLAKAMNEKGGAPVPAPAPPPEKTDPEESGET